MNINRCIVKCLIVTIVMLFYGAALFAQDYDILFPEERQPRPQEGVLELPKPPEEIKEEEIPVLIQSINALVLITDPKLIKPEGYYWVKGVVSMGPRDDLLQKKEILTELNKYINNPATFNTLQKIAREIVIFYRKNDRPIVDVLIPEQEVKNGSVQILVMEGVLGKIEPEGNEYFKSDFLIKQMDMKSGDRFSQRELEYSLDWINSNPFRRVDLIFTPGKETGSTDLILKTKDKWPVRVFGGYDNTGTFITDTIRWSAGVNWGNSMWLDQQANFQFITSPNFKNLVGYAGSYVVPLPWRHSLSFLASYATSEAIPSLTPFQINGVGWQLSGRYEAPLLAPIFLEGFRHAFQFGFDFKQTNNTLAFGEQAGQGLITDTTVDVDQFLWGYNAYLKDETGGTAGDIKLVYSPGNMSSNNTNTAFQTLRFEATAEYIYGLLQIERLQRLLWEFSLYSKLYYQFTNTNLLPSEELGVGGHQTVRGYQERAANGDRGYVFHSHLFSPPMHPLKKLFKINDELKLLLFFDYGVATDNILLTNEPRQYNLASIGPGLRYSIPPNVSIRFDYGFPFLASGDFFSWSHGHIGIIASW